MRASPRISVFPKCYFDELVEGRMSYEAWIREAASLGGDGVEHYDGFFRSYAREDVEPILEVMRETNQISSMLCFSPDFTHPDAEVRQQEIARQKAAIDLTAQLGARHCRTLSGQNFPGLTRAEGIERTVECILRSLEHAERRAVVLCMENHYKDGRWRYPEFAQPEDIFLEIIGRIESPYFGVQYDPSNAIVGGYDPIRFLEKVKHRVVTMHASDRYLENGTLDDLKRLDASGAEGYASILRHGVIGKGLNDYDRIFSTLQQAGFRGWISIEDGSEPEGGMERLSESAEFLRARMRQHGLA